MASFTVSSPSVDEVVEDFVGGERAVPGVVAAVASVVTEEAESTVEAGSIVEAENIGVVATDLAVEMGSATRVNKVKGLRLRLRPRLRLRLRPRLRLRLRPQIPLSTTDNQPVHRGYLNTYGGSEGLLNGV
jgi:hypothetical protein